VDKITTPMLITDPEDEQFFPGQKVLAQFTAAQGANGHCEPMARHRVDLRMGDFFADQLAKADS
jgi:hypothetical protein